MYPSCDCYINNTTPDFVDRIVYCPTHRAADQMRNALGSISRSHQASSWIKTVADRALVAAGK